MRQADKVSVDLYPFILKFEDGHIERLVRNSFVPACDDPAASGGVATRDVVVDHSTGVSARLFLPSDAAGTGRRLPVVMYVHGGSFCTGSAFSRTYHRYAASLAARAGALIVSVEYRLAPEYPIPAAYDDAWAALRWVATASLSDPWLSVHADSRRVFLAGDSAGGHIAYHTAVRASRDMVDVEGVVIVQPYFWGTERLPSEEAWDDGGGAMFTPEFLDRLWPFVTAGEAGTDDPRLDPPDEEIASLKCQRALVALAGKDIMRDRARRLASRLTGSVTLVELEGEEHCFHLYKPGRRTSHMLMESIVQFINPAADPPTISSARAVRRPCKTTAAAALFNVGVGHLTLRRPEAAAAATARTRRYMVLKPTRVFKDPLGAAAIHGGGYVSIIKKCF